jgi:hypothetical protein
MRRDVTGPAYPCPQTLETFTTVLFTYARWKSCEDMRDIMVGALFSEYHALFAVMRFFDYTSMHPYHIKKLHIMAGLVHILFTITQVLKHQS